VAETNLLGMRDAWHLLRRAGFGAHATEVAWYAQRSRGEAVDHLLQEPPSEARGPGVLSYSTVAHDNLQAWWLERMAAPRFRLQEKMTLFWHDHFPSGVDVINRLEALAEQNAMFRFRGLGSFRTLAYQVTRNRAMLQYLDGRLNRDDAVNENYGRELMELFTLGPRDDDGYDNYGQRDVRGMARSLTGYMYDQTLAATVHFYENRFDATSKVLFYGRPFQRAGNLGVESEDGRRFPRATNVIDALFAHRDVRGRPTLARFLSRKLWAWFATPKITEPVLAELSQVFVASGYNVKTLLRALLVHDAFYTEGARFATAKTPVDFALQALVALDVQTTWNKLPRFLGRMGMSLFDPPGVEGWRHGGAWLATSRYLGRMELAQAIASGRASADGFVFRPVVPRGATPTSLVDAALAQLGCEVSAATRARLIVYVSGGTFNTQSWYEMKLRGLYALILSLPEYQVH
jgi:uncharacterized protein (DUF1800 family)